MTCGEIGWPQAVVEITILVLIAIVVLVYMTRDRWQRRP